MVREGNERRGGGEEEKKEGHGRCWHKEGERPSCLFPSRKPPKYPWFARGNPCFLAQAGAPPKGWHQFLPCLHIAMLHPHWPSIVSRCLCPWGSFWIEGLSLLSYKTSRHPLSFTSGKFFLSHWGKISLSFLWMTLGLCMLPFWWHYFSTICFLSYLPCQVELLGSGICLLYIFVTCHLSCGPGAHGV